MYHEYSFIYETSKLFCGILIVLCDVAEKLDSCRIILEFDYDSLNQKQTESCGAPLVGMFINDTKTLN